MKNLLLVLISLSSLPASLPALADQPLFPDIPPVNGEETLKVECVSQNRSGQRFLGRQVNEQFAVEEANYQCYVGSSEFVSHSCRVTACREIGGTWKGVR
ncbi:MAG: hypothetical protein ACXVB9_16425 [Bdellovibrionota bacterium]